MFRYVIIACVFALTACNRNSSPKTSVHEVTGNTTQRAAAVSAIVAKHKIPPTAIQDAHFVEQQTGDGQLGPSDFEAFYVLEVAPQDVSQWTRLLTPLTAKSEYHAPAKPRDWWIAREAFASLQFYTPDILTGKLLGWIGVSLQTGRIYIFTFTM